MNRLDAFYQKYGVMERLHGDIYVAQKPFKRIELEGYVKWITSCIACFFLLLLLIVIRFCSLPGDEVEMRPLCPNNVKAIHDLYPASEIECVEVFEKLIGTLPGFGVFIHGTDELCAWMMHSYYGAMFSMQTRPEHRRKG